jgi:predicted O-methyltransferase YrrM
MGGQWRKAGRALVRRMEHQISPPTWVRAGHYYSPIPDWKELEKDASKLFGPAPGSLAGIDLNASGQLETLHALEALLDARLYAPGSEAGLRYHPDNNMFGQKSANMLHLMLRHLRPQRIIEVGSGFSTAVMLDTIEHSLGGEVALTCIEPYPKRLFGTMQDGDERLCSVIEERLQEVPMATFEELQSGDILFVDSSHVLKTGSDLCRLFFEILPALAVGTHVHFHDIYYPFEYPREWLEQGRSWNEAYALRLFLSDNSQYTIEFWGSYLHHCHRSEFERVPELFADQSSLWIRKTGPA